MAPRKRKSLPPEAARHFQALWDLWPRGDAKAMAEVRFGEAVERGVDPAFLVRAAKRQIALWERDGVTKPYIPMASTWHFQRRYEDDALADPQTVECSTTTFTHDHVLWPALGDRIGADAFERWIAPCVVSHEPPGTWIIKASSAFRRDYINTHFGPALDRALGQNAYRLL